jgi:hypothetical protein
MTLAIATPMQIYAEWAHAGDGARIVGDLLVPFNAYDHARTKTIGHEDAIMTDQPKPLEHWIISW